jgi:KipI family sensor histidine kinase inhibitor
MPRPRRRGDVPIEISVRYDGEDLAEVAESIGGTVEEVVRLHSEAEYTVAFCGFSPGFAYLAGLPERLHLPRRDTPRVRVPAGSVAIAAHYSAIYPSPSPGGWHLLGCTEDVVWDVHEHPPTRLRPGTRVRFVGIR